MKKRKKRRMKTERIIIVAATAVCIAALFTFLFWKTFRKSALTNMTLYWTGNADDESMTLKWIDFDAGKKTEGDVHLDGYMLNSADDGAGVFCIQSERELLHIVKYDHGMRMEQICSIPSENIIRILAYSDGWLYKVVRDSTNSYGYRLEREDSHGKIETYPVTDYGFGFINREEPLYLSEDQSVWAISSDGKIAFYQFDPASDIGLYGLEYLHSLNESNFDEDVIIAYAEPEGNVHEVCKGGYPAWLDETRLLLMREGKLCVADIVTGNITPFETEDGKQIPLNIYSGSLSVDAERKYILFWPWDYSRTTYYSLGGPMKLISLKTGDQYILPHIQPFEHQYVAISE